MDDAAAIQQLINRYTDGCNRADWDQVLATFTADGVWEIASSGMRISGHEHIRAAMAGFVAGFDYFVQLNTPAVISLDGQRATAQSTIRECGKYKGRNEALEVLGSYIDELVLTADGWRFALRSFHSYGLHTFALTSVGKV